MGNFTKGLTLCVVLSMYAHFANAQVKVGDNPTTINKAAILELESTNKGLLFPRVNLTSTTVWGLAAGSTPVAGMMVYNLKTIAAGFSGTAAYPAHALDGTGIYYWDGTGWVSLKGFKGDAGTAGADGKTLLSGTVSPVNGTGNDGDFYINTATNMIYGPKVAGNWPAGVSLVGPQGAIGSPGSPGAQGPQGIPGPQGPAGTDGVGGKSQAGTGINITGTGTAVDPYIINNTVVNTDNQTISSFSFDNVTGVLTLTLERGNTQTVNIGTLKATASNGLGIDATTGNVQLGGALLKPTTITTDAANTLAIAGLPTGAATDKIVVADVNGVLKTVDQSAVAPEPWRIENTTNAATLNTQNIYQNGNVGIGDFTGAKPIARLDVRGAVRGGWRPQGNIGDYSAAFGYYNEASGQSSFAQGQGQKVTGDNASAFGYYNIVSGLKAMAFGHQNEAEGENSFVMGRVNEVAGESSFAGGEYNKASGNKAFTFGSYNEASGEYSTVFGHRNKASAQSSAAFGDGNTASAVWATVFGNNNTASGMASITSGYSNKAIGNASSVFGASNTAASHGEAVFGSLNAITTGNAAASVGTDALFQIGATYRLDDPYMNALTILKNRNVGMGIEGKENAAKPTERLDIGSGNVRVRDINTIAGLASDKIVVADVNGVLKTVDQSAVAPEPWQIQGTTNKATANMQDIYQMGKVSLGLNNATPKYQLDVNGMFNQTTALSGGITANLHSGDNVIGAGVKGVGLTTQLAGGPLNYVFTGDATATGGFTNQSGLGLIDGSGNNTTFQAALNNLGQYTGFIGTNNGSNFARTLWEPNKITLNVGNGTVSQNFEVEPTLISSTAYPNTRNDVATTAPINFLYTDVSGRFLSAPVSTLGTEPWRIENTTNAATLNTQNIYQNGNVGIGDFTGAKPIARLDVRGAVRGGEPSPSEVSGASAIGVNSAAFGEGNYARGKNSMAFGASNEVSGEYAVGLGGDHAVSAEGAMAAGFRNDIAASGKYAAAIGYGNVVKGEKSFTVGNLNYSTSDNSMVLGEGLKSASRNELVAGRYNAITTGSANSWVPTDPLFQLGNGVDDNTRENALTVFKNADIDIYGQNVRMPYLPSAVAAQSGDSFIISDPSGNLKKVYSVTAAPRFFYSPSVVLPTSNNNLPAGVTYNAGTQTFTANLYTIYSNQFGMAGLATPTISAVKSPSATSLPVLPVLALEYFVTYFDNTVFDPASITLDDNGVLTYKILPAAVVTEKTYMNIVFKVK